MKFISTILFFITGLSYGQLIEHTLPKTTYKTRILVDTTTLPFFDDFSTTTGSTPLSSNWINGGTMVTSGYAIDPPSFNALTFDGLDASGTPYTFVGGTDENISVDIDGETDQIESKAIDLSTLTRDDSVAISFFWQKGGVSQNTLPDLKDGDTLRLFFLDKTSNWVKVWPTDSTNIATMDTLSNGKPFNFEFLRIEDTSYFHSGFKFKFTTYGKTTGAWDVWNIDHIYLNKNRADDNIQDFAFSSLNAPLFGEFYNIPVEALVNNNFTLTKEVTVKAFNISNAQNFIGFSSLTVSHPASRTTLSSNVQSGDLLQPRKSTDLTFSINEATFINGVTSISLTDTISLLTKATLETPNDSISSNDTLSVTTKLSNYYAYDDGSAEMGVGFGEYGEFVMEFSLDRIDTLTAIDFGFLKIGHDLTNTPISIRVWQKINGVNRSNSSEKLTSLFTGVKYDSTGLSRYNLSEAIILSPGKYYVGYESATLNPIYLGFDKNTDNIKQKCYMRRGADDWSQDEIKNISGTPIIHPIFGSTLAFRFNNEVEQSGVKTSLNMSIYPLPAKQTIDLVGAINSYKIINSQGVVVQQNKTPIQNNVNTINIRELPDGLYLLYGTDGRLEESVNFIIAK